MNKCKWKDVPGYEGIYQACEDGRVRSIDRIDYAGRNLKGIIFKPVKIPNGYLAVDLTKCSKTKRILVHRVIAMTFIQGFNASNQIDHINHNKKDNSVSNLRLSNSSKNKANTKKMAGCTSIYKGVSWSKNRNKWQTSIKKNGKSYYLGMSKNEEECGRMYDAKAVELFGEHALTNRMLGLFPESDDLP